jgi:RNA polymerase sigma-70 factor (ECF subfamily)
MLSSSRQEAPAARAARVKSEAVNPGRTKAGSVCATVYDAGKSHDAGSCSRADDEAIVSGLKAREEWAFHMLVNRYASTVCRVAFGITGIAAAAEEIAQEVFTRAHFAVPRLARRTPLYPWIYRIAIDECYTFLSRRPLTEPISVGIANSDRSGTHRDLINRFLAELPEDERWILIAKEIEGISLSELSRTTRLDEQTLKSRLFHARQNLLSALRKSEMAVDPSTM